MNSLKVHTAIKYVVAAIAAFACWVVAFGILLACGMAAGACAFYWWAA